MSTYQYPTSAHYQNILKQYLKTKLNTATHLENLVLLLSVSKQTLNPRTNRYTVFAAIENINDLIEVFKYGVLLQRALICGCVPDSSIILEAVRNKFCGIYCWKGMGEDAAKFLKDKILIFYLGYLEKRIYDFYCDQNHPNHCKTQPDTKLSVSKPTDQKQKIVCSSTQNTTSKPTSPKQNFNIRGSFNSSRSNLDELQVQEHLQQCFYLINLLNKALSFWPATLTFIRYFGGYFGCIEDFNVTMAMDLAQVYDRLLSQSKLIRICLEKMEINNQGVAKKINLIEEIKIVFNEIEKANQRLYLVYFNCYYVNSLKRHSPTFVDTQNNLKLIQKKLNQLNKQKKVNEFFQIMRENSPLRRKSVKIVHQLTKSSIKMKKTSEIITNNLRYSHFEEKKSLLDSLIHDSKNKRSENYEKQSTFNKNDKIFEDISNSKDLEQSTGFQFVQSEDEQMEYYENASNSDKQRNSMEENVQLLIEMSIVVDTISNQVS